MTPTMWWRLVLAAALAAAAWYVVHLIRENAEQDKAIISLTAGIRTLNTRANNYDAALVANDASDDQTRQQASTGVAHNERSRRTDNEVVAIDKPWPAAMRRRVFDNPDPASGSTTAASAAGAGERGGPVPKP